MKKHQEAERGHLLSAASARYDAPAPIVKGHATFWVGVEGETPRRFAVPVGLLGHPRILELLMEAKEEYGYTHEGAIVVPCSAERFRRRWTRREPKNGAITVTTTTSACLTLQGTSGHRMPFLRIDVRRS